LNSIEALARQCAAQSMEAPVKIAPSRTARVAAATAILDRAFGGHPKPSLRERTKRLLLCFRPASDRGAVRRNAINKAQAELAADGTDQTLARSGAAMPA
jgi:hypothetical protein